MPLAQLDRAFDYESKGREFESLRARFFTTKVKMINCREVAQLGRVLGLGPRGRRFESCLPDHDLPTFYRFAGVAEWADATDLKSVGSFSRTGSSPVLGTSIYFDAGVVQW